MSGTAFGNWVFSNRGITETKKVAIALGCGSVFYDSLALKNCLRNKSVDDIHNSANNIVRNLSALITNRIIINLLSIAYVNLFMI